MMRIHSKVPWRRSLGGLVLLAIAVNAQGGGNNNGQGNGDGGGGDGLYQEYCSNENTGSSYQAGKLPLPREELGKPY